MGLKQIGSLEPGKNADIVIFDYERIIDRADFSSGEENRTLRLRGSNM